MSRLSLATCQQTGTALPSYLAGTILGGAPVTHPAGIGLVHLGPGAFFRGHQAWYTHQAMQLAGGDWRICAVSLRSSDVFEALTPQDGLYTLAKMEQQTDYELIGAIAEVLVAPKHYEQVLARMTAPTTHIISMTITEKGYCLTAAGVLDRTLPSIVADVAALRQALSQGDIASARCVSAPGLLLQAVWLRLDAGTKLPVLLSCDNLTDNGHKLKAAIRALAAEVLATAGSVAAGADLADVTDSANTPVSRKALEAALSQLICPCSMVDSITPATDDALRDAVEAATGLADAWPIKREAFVQWVIEDVIPAPKPAWAQAGVTFTNDVAAFEKAKLRLLNAPHSTMAYLGCLLGVDTVLAAMQHPLLRRVASDLVQQELLPFIAPIQGMDLRAYSTAIFQRFLNPSVRHLLAQIAWDGSQKLPMRLLPALAEHAEAGRRAPLLCLAVASWLQFIRLRASQQPAVPFVDPLAGELLAIAARCTGDATHDLALWLAHPVLAANLPVDKAPLDKAPLANSLLNNSALVQQLSAAYQCVSSVSQGVPALEAALTAYLQHADSLN